MGNPHVSIHHCIVDPISAVPQKQCSHFISKHSSNELLAVAARQAEGLYYRFIIQTVQLNNELFYYWLLLSLSYSSY